MIIKHEVHKPGKGIHFVKRNRLISIEMADDLYHIYSFNKQGCYRPYKGVEMEEVLSQGKNIPVFGVENSGRLYSGYVEETRSQPATNYKNCTREGLHHTNKIVSIPSLAQSILESRRHGKLPNLISEPSERVDELNSSPSFTDSFELLAYYARGAATSRDQNLNNPSSTVTKSDRKLSTEEIIRVAAERYIEFSTKKLEGITTFIHPYGSALSSLSKEETRGADLVHLLLAAADKVGYKQFDDADRFQTHCELNVSDSGNPVERVVLYFTEALRERISRETGTTRRKKISEPLLGSNGLSTGIEYTFLAYYKELPFSKVIQLAAIQEIVASVAIASNVHVIDLQIRSGIHLIGLMQALSERKVLPIELLKVTAVATCEQKVEETGKRLERFANSLNMPFFFQVLFLPDMKYIKTNFFDVKVDEAVVVYCTTVLRTMISRPDTLENLMRVMQSVRPSIMVVSEIEASYNSPSFVNRFTEALFFFGAYFDCLADCMDRNNPCRIDIERNHFAKCIVNIVPSEGDERIVRSVKIQVWIAFFARFQMVEIELSKSSLYKLN